MKNTFSSFLHSSTCFLSFFYSISKVCLKVEAVSTAIFIGYFILFSEVFEESEI